MTAEAMLDLKQRMAKLTVVDRREVAAYLLRLRDKPPARRWKMSRVMREMDQGKKIRLTDLAKQLGHAR